MVGRMELCAVKGRMGRDSGKVKMAAGPTNSRLSTLIPVPACM